MASGIYNALELRLKDILAMKDEHDMLEELTKYIASINRHIDRVSGAANLYSKACEKRSELYERNHPWMSDLSA